MLFFSFWTHQAGDHFSINRDTQGRGRPHISFCLCFFGICQQAGSHRGSEGHPRAGKLLVVCRDHNDKDGAVEVRPCLFYDGHLLDGRLGPALDLLAEQDLYQTDGSEHHTDPVDGDKGHAEGVKQGDFVRATVAYAVLGDGPSAEYPSDAVVVVRSKTMDRYC